MKKCTNCNTENSAESLFCEKCGTSLDALKSTKNMMNEIKSTNKPDVENSNSASDMLPKSKKKKVIKTIFIIVSIVCITSIAIWLCLPFFTNPINYKSAHESFNSGNFEHANETYGLLGDYKNALSQTTESCLMQLNKLIAENANSNEINKWFKLSLARNPVKTHETVRKAMIDESGVNRIIKNGKHDVAYNLLINDLVEYKDKYKDIAYTLANEYVLNIKDYEKGKNLLSWIGDNSYKDTEKLLSEITYQYVVANIKDDPQSVIKDLYPLAKANYNDSRSLLESIYTSDELFGKLQFSNVKTVEEQASILFYDVEMEGGTRNCNVELVVKNNSDVPVVGDVSVKCAFFSEYEGRLSKTSSINIKLAPGEEKAFKSSRFSFEGLGAFEKPSVSKNTGNGKLRIEYE